MAKSLSKHTTGLLRIYSLRLLKWLLIAVFAGLCIGSVSAFFLASLNWVTDYRENNMWIISLLPVGGLLIGLSYYYWGSSVVKGNNLLLEELHTPKTVIPLRMAPLVLAGTLITHLVGGSAGREGTAVQMGGAIADQFTKLFHIKSRDRKILIIIGISAGFASVFGTPFAAVLFALEVMLIRKVRYEAILPCIMASFMADYVCKAWHISHTIYMAPSLPAISVENILWTAFAGVLFGLAAMLFAKTTHTFGKIFNTIIKYPPLRPFIGGILLVVFIWLLGTTTYCGLGIPTIVASFGNELPSYTFILKLLLTAFTLGAGFKGGEVTPLFFIGATLGNALFLFVPLPLSLLAAMGFVAVFSGAANTPLACTVMGMELFGIDSGLYIGIACITAYFFSGHTGIYNSQLVEGPKLLLYKNIRKIYTSNTVTSPKINSTHK